MKGFGWFAILAVSWILLIIVFSAQAASLPKDTLPSEDGRARTDNADLQPNNSNDSSSTVYDYVAPETVSAIVGAALGDQDCLAKTACKAGSYVSSVSGKELFLVMLDRWVPDSWQDTLKVFKESAVYGDDCEKQFKCSTE